jgi:hypothetical protein
MKNHLKLYLTYLVVFCAVILTTVSAAQAKTFLVNVETDQHDTAPGDGICHAGYRTCTLRAAIEEANALAGDDTIEFSASFQAPNPPRTIVLTLGQLLTDSALTISGPGARQLAIDGAQKDRIMTVNSQYQAMHAVLISGLTFQNGTPASSGYAQGGAIFVANTNLTLSAVTVRNNKTIARLWSQAGQGDGGGIFNFGSYLTILDSTITGNVAEIRGGGIFSRDSHGLVIYNSTISNNAAKQNGGGIGQTDNSTIKNTTISNNTAFQNGGGVWVENVNADGYNSFGNTIVANNVAVVDKDVSGTINSLGYNLVKIRGASTGYIASDLPDGTDPKLGSLKNNGGPTDTRALLELSPAINAGDDCIVLGNPCTGEFQYDQRGFGFPRKNGRRVDIGAYEYQPTVIAFVPILGKVFKSGGRGVSRAVVTLTAADGTMLSAETDEQGRYRFEGVERGKSYVLKVENSEQEYEPQTLLVNEARNDVNLVPVDDEPETETPQN